jgi:hypothetical protein
MTNSESTQRRDESDDVNYPQRRIYHRKKTGLEQPEIPRTRKAPGKSARGEKQEIQGERRLRLWLHHAKGELMWKREWRSVCLPNPLYWEYDLSWH